MDPRPNQHGMPPKAAPPNHPTSQLLSTAALTHAMVFGVALAWLFGGNSLGLRLPLLLLGSFAFALPLLSLLPALRSRHYPPRQLLLLLPLLGLNGLVAASLLNPNFHALTAWGTTTLIPGGDITWLPSCARPAETAAALWLTDCLYLTAFNLYAFVRRRALLRRALILLCANAALLAAFGTLQKLSGATGLYFGLVPSTNPTFFASFVYHNHWGAFAVLWLCCAFGLIWHFARRADGTTYRDFFHSPGLLFLLGALLIAATPPLSTSRSCTALVGLILLGATVHCLRHLYRRHHSFSPRLLAPLLSALAALAAIIWLAAPVLEARLETTRVQLSEFREIGGLGARATLYRDTLRLAADRPLFGWGKASYPTAFYNYNTQLPKRDRLPVFYADAHSDWLQCLAELGSIGALVTALTALLPLWLSRATLLSSQLSRWLLLGCSLILLYAWVEFPFGNPAVTLSWWTCFFISLRYPQAD